MSNTIDSKTVLQNKMSEESFAKITALGNSALIEFIAEYATLCNPKDIFVCDDSAEDNKFIAKTATELGEEKTLNTKGHTIHFDGPKDQARDKANTKYLVEKGVNLGERLNTIDKEEGTAEVLSFLKNSMEGKTMIVAFYCLGPINSDFSLSCAQITDSFYVAHSESILYRTGYEQFKSLGDTKNFFRFVHTAGEIENGVSKNVENRRVFMNLDDNIVYSTNTQYAGNTVGLKKLAMRLAINKCKDEGWLTEHMFILGVNGKEGRQTYFTGAFPSACGKTSTAMLKDETIVGDDIAYIRARDGKAYAANVEKGIFGIIRDVSDKDDPEIWKVLNSPGEVIFSNVLLAEDNNPYWLGMGIETPKKGKNYSGDWEEGNKDAAGNDLSLAHKNSRYTIEIERLENSDKDLNNPEGVPVSGFIYGGRDSDTSVPVTEAFDFTHGILTMGAAIESETTAATLGKAGVRSFNLMSILDFLSYPMGTYLQNNLDFGAGLDVAPKVYNVNYFQKKDGEYMTGMHDKRVWVKWMELRVHGEVEAIETPAGNIPKYEDLKRLFKEVLDKDYSEEDYTEQFTTRVPELLAKIERIRKVYKDEVNVPAEFKTQLDAQEARLKELQSSKGDYVSPLSL